MLEDTKVDDLQKLPLTEKQRDIIARHQREKLARRKFIDEGTEGLEPSDPKRHTVWEQAPSLTINSEVTKTLTIYNLLQTGATVEEGKYLENSSDDYFDEERVIVKNAVGISKQLAPKVVGCLSSVDATVLSADEVAADEELVGYIKDSGINDARVASYDVGKIAASYLEANGSAAAAYVDEVAEAIEVASTAVNVDMISRGYEVGKVKDFNRDYFCDGCEVDEFNSDMLSRSLTKTTTVALAIYQMARDKNPLA